VVEEVSFVCGTLVIEAVVDDLLVDVNGREVVVVLVCGALVVVKDFEYKELEV